MKSMSSTQLQAYVGQQVHHDRSHRDYYSTPEQCTLDLLERETFEGEIWECACGDGAISKVLLQHNYKVKSSDIEDRGYGIPYVNFLRQEDLCDNIVTNPPFSLSTEFCMKALKLARNKVAIFNKLSFLESKIRQHIFKQGYLKNIYVYSKRVNLQKNQQQNIGMLAFAWFVFDKTYQGRPTLDWI